jgi:Ca2+-binding RTX toxin-like protein
MPTKDDRYSNPRHARQGAGGLAVKRKTILTTLAMALAGFAATAVPASAAVSSASINGTTATLNLDGSGNNETISVSNGVLVHTGVGGGLNSSSDWDSATPGDQTVPADGTFTVVVHGGAGNDAITVLAKNTEIAEAKLFGEGGDDVLTGADTNDFLDGGEGNDRLVGAKGTDLMNGGTGNDTFVWNNGDGPDRINGEAGNDVTEVNHPRPRAGRRQVPAHKSGSVHPGHRDRALPGQWARRERLHHRARRRRRAHAALRRRWAR